MAAASELNRHTHVPKRKKRKEIRRTIDVCRLIVWQTSSKKLKWLVCWLCSFFVGYNSSHSSKFVWLAGCQGIRAVLVSRQVFPYVSAGRWWSPFTHPVPLWVQTRGIRAVREAPWSPALREFGHHDRSESGIGWLQWGLRVKHTSFMKNHGFSEPKQVKLNTNDVLYRYESIRKLTNAIAQNGNSEVDRDNWWEEWTLLWSRISGTFDPLPIKETSSG